jgi:AcrR family transcriptional regulator
MAVERTTRLDPDEVVVAAEQLVTAQGWEALTMAALAADLGVRAPSLYRHVESLDALRRALRLRTVVEMTDAVRAAVMGKSGLDGLHALTEAFRSYAKANPVRYLAQTSLPGDDAMRAAGRRLGEAGYAVLASFGLRPQELPVATAQLAALCHGFVSLELVQTMDWVTDPDAAYYGLVELFAVALEKSAAAPARPTKRKGKRS